MSGRILWIELRRSSALWAGALFLGLTLALLYGLSGPWWKGSGAWDQQWAGLAEWERVILTFVWPMVVGVGALPGLRNSRSGMTELLSTTSRSAWHRAAQTAGALAIGLTGGYVAIFLVGAVQVVGNTSYFSWGWLPIALIGILSVIGGAWLGMGISRLVPSALTPPLVAVIALVAMVMLGDPASASTEESMASYRVALLAPAGKGAGDVFTKVTGTVEFAQALCFLGMAVTGFLLLTANGSRARLASALPVLVSVSVALALLPADAAQSREIDRAATALACTDGGPRVCVTRAHKDFLKRLAVPGQEALMLLAKLPNAPAAVQESTIHQPYYGRPPQLPGVTQIDFDDWDLHAGATVTDDPDRLRRYLLAGAGTPSCFGSRELRDQKFMRERAARTVAAAWFTGELKPLSGSSWLAETVDGLARPAWQALRALPAPEQFARIVALRTAAETCHGDLLSILTNGVPR